MNRQLLKEEMDKRGLNITRLAEVSGVDKSLISRILSGDRDCNVLTAQKLAKGMKLSNTKTVLIFFGDEVAETQLTAACN